MTHTLLCALLLFCVTTTAWADLEKALNAYRLKDYATALQEFRADAMQGNTSAQSNLGLMYANGQGVPQDYAEAAKWYRKAAEQGLASAQYNLGISFANGQGVPQDYAEAAKWYRKAADQGDANAQLNLGLMYANGQGVPQDYAEAAKWFRKAAEQGHAKAQLNLGVSLTQGMGVMPKDRAAYEWIALASTRLTGQNRETAVQILKDLESRMTPSDLAKAQRKVQEWERVSVPEAPIPGLEMPNYAVVRVFFATDRNLTESKKADEMFGAARSTLRYGTCDVSIPHGHRIGELESPSIWKLQFREDPAKHVVLLNVLVQPKDKFFADLAARVRASAKASAFIFVHGYNVSFEDAARRTAQMWKDLEFAGAPVFYSWPSQGTTPAYTVDEQNIEWAQANLKGFLEDFLSRSEAQNVYLIAHSMGNRALTRAVASLLVEKPSLRQRLKEVILAAPDIDAEVFKRDIAPALTEAGRPITLYASSNDLALVASKKVHGNPRAGDSGQGLVVVPGIETIDATDADTSLLGHSYFAETRSIVSDISDLIRYNHQADQRFGLQRVDTKTGRYWVFKR